MDGEGGKEGGRERDGWMYGGKEGRGGGRERGREEEGREGLGRVEC